MSLGLLAGLYDPVLKAQVAERERLIATLADRWSVTHHDARHWLKSWEDVDHVEMSASGVLH
ncbi:hypothetical protein [Bradyrhizobium sp. ORS 86]|uniref:hypothetical protein n=1 Tax=Bradyrhizobium sp. ORS 86 TaxID=1685970 RepID=UPI00388D275C